MSYSNLEQEQEEDFLSVDSPIPGQNYVCLSFVSPETLMKKKEVFSVKHFLSELLNNEDKKNLILNQSTLSYKQVDELYEGHKLEHNKVINKEFNEANDYKTSLRCMKVRGIYDTLKEAEYRAKKLQNSDKNFHVFVGQVGYWLPWDPDPNQMKDQEFMNDKLNELMKKYQENSDHKDFVFDKTTKERMGKAREHSNKNKTNQDRENDKKNIDELREVAIAKEGTIRQPETPALFKDDDTWMKQKEGKVFTEDTSDTTDDTYEVSAVENFVEKLI